MLEETDASGVAQADYIYLNGRPIATLNPATGVLYFLHDDMLGTPQLGRWPGQTPRRGTLSGERLCPVHRVLLR